METAVSRITPDQLKELMRTGETVVFLSVQSHREKDWGFMKVRGALRVPVEEVEQHLEEIPRDHPVVIYCTGPGDDQSLEAAELLHRHGWTRVHVLIGGFNAYREAGLPVEDSGIGSETRKIMWLS